MTFALTSGARELSSSTRPAAVAADGEAGTCDTAAGLMGADIPQSEPMRSAYLTLTLDSEADAERVYGLRTDGGGIFMKMERTPFTNRFALLRDRFGTS